MSEINAIRVDDQDFLVTSLIERCPKTMMIRELFKNAVEAAEQLPSGRGRVEFGVTDEFFGTPKLTVWNNGPGMNESELRQMTNLAASIRKLKGLDANFGMGAKVASLPSNREGLVYRSCKGGQVHETILCEREGAFGRLRRYGADGSDLGDVIDVTAQVDAACVRDVKEDWTEVTLLGNRKEQNTALDPYDGDPAVKKFWLANALYHRFYRLPNIKVILEEGTQARDGRRTFETIPKRIEKGAFSNHESVKLQNGIVIHYIYDAPFNDTSHNKSVSGAVASALSTCAVIYKGEMYSVAMGRDWTIQAPTFGVSFGAKHISVHIELPENFKVRPEAYRQFIRYIEGEQAQVYASDFAALVLENRPEWLIALIRSLAPNAGKSDEEIRNNLQELLNRFKVKIASPTVSADGPLDVDPGSATGGRASGRGASVGGAAGGGGGTRKSATDLSIVNTGAQMARMAQNMQRAPKLIRLNDEQEISDKKISGRAGRYYPETGELYINMRYPAVEGMREQLRRKYAHAHDAEIMLDLVNTHSEDSMVRRVGRGVVFALAKRLSKEWDEESMSKALEPESLSISADNFEDSLQDARRAIGQTLKVRRGSSDAEELKQAS